jgi:GrpB-like predicted nucleotidyltransferase (UPF0157 family)
MNPRLSKPILTNLVQTLRRWLKRNPEEQDPYARVRVPVRKGPGSRSAAVALEEPDK